ncbi:O-acetyl-ADP-ribose deacetylase [Agrilutibacter solisilvae]|uniref:O-acetyl-ADP-ribose deacetylase n=1 Tax=Agrilutibacter solisilvae TaxID=2763317 RepID=A0A974Y5C8_9GAMM|nr:O-acetyl-ADP-ribose deacetylase [Lysobacter solisilvae]QSX78616.1 O-acetyl-ADP-ribose deacetylase [Lysobacter solisilvae]
MDIEILQADITALAVDAIVNAANSALCGGGGVDGAIHRAAGPGLLAECRALPEIEPEVRCPTGQARITRGCRLHARHVIHTVGPVWGGGHDGEADLLASCYRESLRLAEDNNIDSIAFPAISCGVYGYPVESAAPVAVATLREWAQTHERPRRVILCCYDARTTTVFREALGNGGD